MKLSLVFSVLTAVTSPLSAQWESRPYSSGTIHTEGALILVEAPGGIEAFSAYARRWVRLTGAGVAVVDTGDWCALMELEPRKYLAYSSRRHEAAPLSLDQPVIDVRVEDDVALVMTANPQSGFVRAYAYSAHWNHWRSVGVGTLVSFASSRFVASVQSPAELHGFSARTGEWNTLPAEFCAGPQADGNVAAFDVAIPGTDFKHIAAFSGVLGRWSLSPALTNEVPTLIDHNVAYGRCINPEVSCGYSAYSGCWATVAKDQPLAYGAVVLRDNLILIERTPAPGLVAYEAFGAMPGREWAVRGGLAGSFSVVGIGESMAVCDRSAGDRWTAFSGVRGGLWVDQSYAGTHAQYFGSEHVALLGNSLLEYYAFSPLLAEWSAKVVPPSDSFIEARAEGSYAVLVTADERWGYSPRFNDWSRAPRKAESYRTSAGGSVFVQQRCSGDAPVFRFLAHDQRQSGWRQLTPRGVECVDTRVDRNTFLAHSSAERRLIGYSAQLGEFREVADFDLPAGTDLGTAADLDENVAWVLRDNDGAVELWAFGAMGDCASWYQYPDGTEYTRLSCDDDSGDPCDCPGGTSVSVRQWVTVSGEPGTRLFFVLSTRRLFSPIILPGVGHSLWLDPASWFIIPAGSFNSDGLRHFGLKLPAGPALGLEIWFQAIRLSASGTEFTPDQPGVAWIY